MGEGLRGVRSESWDSDKRLSSLQITLTEIYSLSAFSINNVSQSPDPPPFLNQLLPNLRFDPFLLICPVKERKKNFR